MIQSIDTEYDGHKFRSRLEARWAVFFNEFGIKYEYEPKGFEYKGERYLPDFWLPEQHVWFEVKRNIEITDGEAANRDDESVYENAIAKARWLADDSYAAVVAFGNPYERGMVVLAHDMGETSGGPSEWVGDWDICGYCHKPTLHWRRETYHWIGSSDFQSPAGCGCKEISGQPQYCPYAKERLRIARDRARYARFEHGETPEVDW